MKKIKYGVFLSVFLLSLSALIFSSAVANESALSIYLPLVLNGPSTPEPTPEPSGVQILDNDTHYIGNFGLLNVVAEVQNNTDNTVNLDLISVKFYDAGDNLLETEFAIVVLDNLPANEKTCFDVELTEPSGWSYYEIETPNYVSIGDFPFPDLTVINDSFTFNSGLGFYEIEGQVRNDHGSTVDDITLVGTLYNASGEVIGCDAELLLFVSLNPGEIQDFDISFIGRDYADYDSHRVQADGDTLP